MIYLIICLSLLLAGFIQGVSGFGAGIVFMSIVPYFLSVTASAAISNFVCLMLEIMMVIRYRKHINKSIILLPAIFFIIAATAGIHLASNLDTRIMKEILGSFLILLAVYMMVFRSKMNLQPTLLTMFVCGFVSGLCDGMFSIGGPLMVLYFLAITKSKEEYLGTIQTFFGICAIYNLALRTYRGLFTIDLLGYALVGTAAIFLGLKIGNRVVDRIDDQIMQKIVCVMIGISGAVTLVTALISA